MDGAYADELPAAVPAPARAVAPAPRAADTSTAVVTEAGSDNLAEALAALSARQRRYGDAAEPAGPPGRERDVDYDRRLRRAVEVSTVGCSALVMVSVAAVAASGAQRLTDHPLMMSGFASAAALIGLALARVLPRQRRRGLPGAGLGAATLLAAALAADAGLVASAGGVGGPFWLVFLPIVLATAAAVDTVTAVTVGLFAAVAAGVAAVLAAGTATADLARLLVVLPLFPVAGWLSAALTRTARLAGEEATARRVGLERDVAELSRLLRGVAAGDLSRVPSLPEGASAATTALAVAFADTLLALRRLVRQVGTVGEQISASADEVRAGAREQATAVGHQIEAVQETTTTIEELAATAAQIADTAERLAGYAASTLQEVEQGAAAVDESVAAMTAIADRVDALTERAEGLCERAGRIGTILAVLDELSQQTNLLAFNAAVEAARAGEHGHGFTVVAGEVRKLSERARAATGQVRDILTVVAAETNAAAEASRSGAAEAREGVRRSDGVVLALARIQTMATQTTAAAREITVATRQQRAAAEAVVAAMAQVSDVNATYGTGSRRHLSAAEALSTLAASFGETVRRFRVGGGTDGRVG